MGKLKLNNIIDNEDNILDRIPNETYLEKHLPIKKISDLALKEGNSKKPVYEIHKWWARRLSIVVRALIIAGLLPEGATEELFWKKFYSKNLSNITVLDCFMGGGTSLVEAKKLGAKTIGFDIDPMACFVTKKELEECNQENIIKEFKRLEEKVGREIRNSYKTKINDIEYPVINVFWVYEVECEQCKSKVQTHPHYKLFYNKKEQVVFCSKCGTIETIDVNNKEFICSNCGEKTVVNDGPYKRGYCTCPDCGKKFKLLGKVNGSHNLKMFAIEYENKLKRSYKKVDEHDIKLYEDVCMEAKSSLKNYYVPNKDILVENRKDKRPVSYGYKNYKDLFNCRQLLSLAKIYDEIINIQDKSLREWLIIAFSDCLASNNLLCNYAYGYKKLTPLFGIHAYTVPVRPVENNVWGSGLYGRGTFEKAVKKLIKSKKYCDEPYECSLNEKGAINKIFTGEKIASKITHNPTEFYNGIYDSLIINSSSEKLDGIKDQSIDMILTDPPYYDNLNYSELADFYYQWIKDQLKYNGINAINDSLYVNYSEEFYHEKYESRLIMIFQECHKKLKDDGIMIFSYHHNKKEAWISIGNAIKNSGFIITNVLPIRSEGQSAYHSGEKSIKWDSILVLRKKSFNKSNKEELKNIINDWQNNIKLWNLEMKDCDILSFYRSLGIMLYSNNLDLNIDIIFEQIDCYIKTNLENSNM